jgi:hypothetical protein
LGERILAEWEPSSGRTDNLTRWLAHYLAETFEAAKTEIDPARRSRLRRECADLILAIWKHRKYWPRGQPFKALGALIEELSEQPSPFSPREQPRSWGGLIKQLDDLHKREKRWLMEAAAANESEKATNEWEQAAIQFFSNDESRLATLRRQLFGDSATTSLKAEETSAEKHRRLLEALRNLQDERAKLHSLIKADWFEATPEVSPKTTRKAKLWRRRARG